MTKLEVHTQCNCGPECLARDPFVAIAVFFMDHKDDQERYARVLEIMNDPEWVVEARADGSDIFDMGESFVQLVKIQSRINLYAKVRDEIKELYKELKESGFDGPFSMAEEIDPDLFK